MLYRDDCSQALYDHIIKSGVSQPFTGYDVEDWVVDNGYCNTINTEEIASFLKKIVSHPMGIDVVNPPSEQTGIIPEIGIGKKKQIYYSLKPRYDFILLQGNEDEEVPRTIYKVAPLELLFYFYRVTETDPITLRHFVLGIGHFVDSKEFFEELITQFKSICDSNDSADSLANLSFHQFRLANITKLCIDFAFCMINDVIGQFRSFIDYANTKAPTVGSYIAKNLRSTQLGTTIKVLETEPPPPVLVPQKKSSADWKLTDLPTLEVARQLCLIEYENISHIPVSEYQRLRWTTDQSPNLQISLDFSLRLAYWIAWVIVKETKLKKRLKHLVYVINLGKFTLDLENYNSLNSIYIALNLSCITRLTKTWREVPKASMSILKKINNIMSPFDSYASYREQIRDIHKAHPMVACQEIILKELMTVSETTDDFMEDAQKKERKIINNIKLDTIGKLINEAKFQNYQSKYNLLIEPKIREILTNIPLLDLDTLNGASVVAEEEAKEANPVVVSKKTLTSSAPVNLGNSSKDLVTSRTFRFSSTSGLNQKGLSKSQIPLSSNEDLDMEVKTLIEKSIFRKKMFQLFLESEFIGKKLNFLDSCREFKSNPKNWDVVTSIIKVYFSPSSDIVASQLNFPNHLIEGVMNTFNKEKDLQANYNGEKKGSENNSNTKVDTTSPMAINLGQKKMTVLDLTKIYEKAKENNNTKFNIWNTDVTIFDQAIEFTLEALETPFQRFLASEEERGIDNDIKGFDGPGAWFDRLLLIKKATIVLFFKEEQVLRMYINEWNRIHDKVLKQNMFMFAVNLEQKEVDSERGFIRDLMRRWDLVIDVIYDSTNQITTACKVPSVDGNLLPGVCIFTGKKILYSWFAKDDKKDKSNNAIRYPDPVDIWTHAVLQKKKPETLNSFIKMGNPLTGAGWSIANREKLKLADETPLTNPMSPRTIGDSVKRLRDSFIIKSEVTNVKSPRGSQSNPHMTHTTKASSTTPTSTTATSTTTATTATSTTTATTTTTVAPQSASINKFSREKKAATASSLKSPRSGRNRSQSMELSIKNANEKNDKEPPKSSRVDLALASFGSARTGRSSATMVPMVKRASQARLLQINNQQQQQNKSKLIQQKQQQSQQKIYEECGDDFPEIEDFLDNLRRYKITAEDIYNFIDNVQAKKFRGLRYFISDGGLKLFILFLEPKMLKSVTDESLNLIQEAIMNSLAVILTTPIGWKAMLDFNDNCLVLLVKIINTKKTQLHLQTAILDVLAACCLIPGGHKVVTQAFKEFQEFKKEPRLFYSLVESLMTSRVDVEYLISAMGLINCIVNSPVDLETRCNNREMFSNLGVQTCVTYFQDTYLSGELHIQLDVWNNQYAKDISETKNLLQLSEKIIDSDPIQIFDALHTSVTGTTYYSCLVNVMKSIVEFQSSAGIGREIWQVLEYFFRNASDLKSKEGGLNTEALYSLITDQRRTVKQIKKDLRSHYNDKFMQSTNIDKVVKLTNHMAMSAPPSYLVTGADMRTEIDHQVIQLKKLVTTLSSENSKLTTKYEQLEADYDELHQNYTYIYNLCKDRVEEAQKKEKEEAKLKEEEERRNKELLKKEEAKNKEKELQNSTGNGDVKTSIQEIDKNITIPPEIKPSNNNNEEVKVEGDRMAAGGGGLRAPRGGNDNTNKVDVITIDAQNESKPQRGGGPRGGPPPRGGRGGPNTNGRGGNATDNNAALFKKLPNENPKIKMKNLNWMKIPDSKVEATWWGKEHITSIESKEPVRKVKFNVNKLESVFSAKVTETKPMKEVKVELCLLDDKKVKNINIMIGSRFKKMTLEEIKQAIISINDDLLSASDFAALSDYDLNEDEKQLFANFGGKIEDLSRGEQYLSLIQDIPNYVERLQSVEFMLTIDELVSDVQPHIQSALYALRQIQECDKLKSVLLLILQIGNYMNGGTVKGGAYGFKFDYLTKLRDTKSSDNKTNLCHFLVMSIEEDNTELKGFIDSVPQLTLAAKVSMDLINPRMTLLRQGVRTIEKLLRNYQKINEEDRYEIVMSKFITEAEEKVRLVEKDLERMNKEYHKFLDSWQETEKNVPLHHVFSTIQIFFTDYRDAEKSLFSEKEREERRKIIEEKKKEAMQRASSKLTNSLHGRTYDDSDSDDSEPFADLLTDQIRTGVAFLHQEDAEKDTIKNSNYDKSSFMVARKSKGKLIKQFSKYVMVDKEKSLNTHRRDSKENNISNNDEIKNTSSSSTSSMNTTTPSSTTNSNNSNTNNSIHSTTQQNKKAKKNLKIDMSAVSTSQEDKDRLNFKAPTERDNSNQNINNENKKKKRLFIFGKKK